MKYVASLFVLLMVAGCSAEVAESSDAPAKQAFQMTIADIFKISGGGIAISGQVASGQVSVGDVICLTSSKIGTRTITVLGLESFNKLLDSANAGDTVGIQISGVEKDEISTGDTVSSHCG